MSSNNNPGIAPFTMNFDNAGFVAGTTSTYTTTASTKGTIDGKFTTALTAQTNTASPTTDASTGSAFVALAPNKATVLVWGTNLAGTIKLCQGSIVDTFPGVTTTVGAFKDVPNFPTLPNDFVAMAYNLVRTAPDAASWTPGTGSWTASGVSATTFKNVTNLPLRPQIA